MNPIRTGHENELKTSHVDTQNPEQVPTSKGGLGDVVSTIRKADYSDRLITLLPQSYSPGLQLPKNDHFLVVEVPKAYMIVNSAEELKDDGEHISKIQKNADDRIHKQS